MGEEADESRRRIRSREVRGRVSRSGGRECDVVRTWAEQDSRSNYDGNSDQTELDETLVVREKIVVERVISLRRDM